MIVVPAVPGTSGRPLKRTRVATISNTPRLGAVARWSVAAAGAWMTFEQSPAQIP